MKEEKKYVIKLTRKEIVFIHEILRELEYFGEMRLLRGRGYMPFCGMIRRNCFDIRAILLKTKRKRK